MSGLDPSWHSDWLLTQQTDPQRVQNNSCKNQQLNTKMAEESERLDESNMPLQFLECPVCLHELQDAKLLSCRHTMCLKCLKEYTDKGSYEDKLPCPICMEVTTLYEGGVDNLPPLSFIKTLQGLIEEDELGEDNPASRSGAVCSTEACYDPAVSYCTQGCQFMCDKCNAEHKSIRITKSHHVIPAAEGGSLTKSNKTPYPSCEVHTYQVMDMFCHTCNLPGCSTCLIVDHPGHDCTPLLKHAAECKAKLDQICLNTDGLISHVQQTIDKTKSQEQKAEVDIDDVCETVKSTFKKLHEKLDGEETKMLSELQEARRRMKKTADVTEERQTMTLTSLENLKYCQIKLSDKGNIYDYVTATDSIQRYLYMDLKKDLSVFEWKSEYIKRNKTAKLGLPGRVDVSQSEIIHNKGKVERMSGVHLENQDDSVQDMVLFKEHVYVVHRRGMTVYHYSPDGTLSDRYKHGSGDDTIVQGMCIMVNGESAVLVVSDFTNKSLVWIKIIGDFTMKTHHVQQLDYSPCGSYNDRGDLMVCDAENNKIYRYRADRHLLSVTPLPDEIMPWRVVRYGDGDKYAIMDWQNRQVIMVDREGDVKKRYKTKIEGYKLGKPYDLVTDCHGRLMIADFTYHQVLLLETEEGEVRQLIQQDHVRYPGCLCVDHDRNMLYVSGRDPNGARHVFVYDYSQLTDDTTFREKIIQLSMTVQL